MPTPTARLQRLLPTSAQKGCRPPESHSALWQLRLPGPANAPPDTPRRPSSCLSPNAPWLPGILCALGGSLVLSEPWFPESAQRLLSACCVPGSGDSVGTRCYCSGSRGCEGEGGGEEAESRWEHFTECPRLGRGRGSPAEGDRTPAGSARLWRRERGGGARCPASCEGEAGGSDGARFSWQRDGSPNTTSAPAEKS